jgi:hypothetical protein
MSYDWCECGQFLIGTDHPCGTVEVELFGGSTADEVYHAVKDMEAPPGIGTLHDRALEHVGHHFRWMTTLNIRLTGRPLRNADLRRIEKAHDFSDPPISPMRSTS